MGDVGRKWNERMEMRLTRKWRSESFQEWESMTLGGPGSVTKALSHRGADSLHRNYHPISSNDLLLRLIRGVQDYYPSSNET